MGTLIIIKQALRQAVSCFSTASASHFFAENPPQRYRSGRPHGSSAAWSETVEFCESVVGETSVEISRRSLALPVMFYIVFSRFQNDIFIGIKNIGLLDGN